MTVSDTSFHRVRRARSLLVLWAAYTLSSLVLYALPSDPVPPAENRLPISIEAGEKTPLDRVRGVVGANGIETPEEPA